MALEREDFARIAAHCSGQMTPDERKLFVQWRNSLSDDDTIRELETIWENSGVRATDPTVNTDEEWNRLKENIQRLDEAEIASGSRSFIWLRIAATLVIITLAGVWLLQPEGKTNKISSTPSEIRISADDGVKTFFLSDSSQIWLNAGSEISYDSTFGGVERRIHLRGEGYFNIASDRSKPFIIETENALVRVVGTAFNLRESDSLVILDVAEGIVRFSTRDTVLHRSMLVRAGETAMASNDAGASKKKRKSPFTGQWRTQNNPVYDNETRRATEFLHARFEWRKNSINHSVIRGKLSSTAELAAYKNVVLHIRYTNARGRVVENDLEISGTIRPGESVNFEKRLFDIFRDIKTMEISVKSADVVNR